MIQRKFTFDDGCENLLLLIRDFEQVEGQGKLSDAAAREYLLDTIESNFDNLGMEDTSRWQEAIDRVTGWYASDHISTWEQDVKDVEFA